MTGVTSPASPRWGRRLAGTARWRITNASTAGRSPATRCQEWISATRGIVQHPGLEGGAAVWSSLMWRSDLRRRRRDDRWRAVPTTASGDLAMTGCMYDTSATVKAIDLLDGSHPTSCATRSYSRPAPPMLMTFILGKLFVLIVFSAPCACQENIITISVCRRRPGPAAPAQVFHHRFDLRWHLLEVIGLTRGRRADAMGQLVDRRHTQEHPSTSNVYEVTGSATPLVRQHRHGQLGWPPTTSSTGPPNNVDRIIFGAARMLGRLHCCCCRRRIHIIAESRSAMMMPTRTRRSGSTPSGGVEHGREDISGPGGQLPERLRLPCDLAEHERRQHVLASWRSDPYPSLAVADGLHPKSSGSHRAGERERSPMARSRLTTTKSKRPGNGRWRAGTSAAPGTRAPRLSERQLRDHATDGSGRRR